MTTDGHHSNGLLDGRYRLLRQIGQGGMARVFVAEDEDLHREVAIKVLADRYAGDDQFLERFTREARAAAGLNHPNIVQVYDRGQADGQPYIAMELVDGETLKDLIVREAPLAPRRAIDLALQILAALRFAHRKDVVHRDVKPQNILVLPDGRAKVADFGIARAGAVDGMTEAGSVVGTAQYLAPEQARGLPVGPPADLYAVGVVLYEMLTGRVPFTADTSVAVAVKHVQEPPPRPRALVPSIPPELEAVVLKALQKDPEDRYATADEFGLELDRVRRAIGSSTTRIVPPAVAATGSETVVGGTAYQQEIELRDRKPPRRAAPPPRRPAPGRGESPWRWALLAALVAVALATGYVIWRSFGDTSSEPAPTPPETSIPSTSTTTESTVAQVTVPDVVGRTEDEASDLLRQQDLRVAVQPIAAEEPEGTVVRQDPAANEQVDPNAIVRIFVSTGPATVTIEDVTGQSCDDALAALRAQKLKPGTSCVEQPSDTVPSGQVIGSDPAAGVAVAPGTKVSVLVSSGPEVRTVAVPAVAGRSLERARGLIEGAGLTVGEVTEVFSDSVDAGVVVESDPPDGTEVEEGAVVNLVVSLGPQQQAVTVPDVGGQTPEAATSALEGVGLTVERIDEPAADPGQVGLVMRTDPAAGESVDAGSTVTIVVGTA